MKRVSRQAGETTEEPNSPRSNAHLVLLAILGALSAFVYLRIAQLSPLFGFHAKLETRPIVGVLLLLGLAFACYLGAIWLVKRLPADRRTWALILGGALLFRVTLLTSTPIQELDIYRYVWDGAVVSKGISPFRYSPQQVKDARPDDATIPDDLRVLVEMRDQNSSLSDVLNRVHFSHVSTVYPPTSQACFVAAHLTTPSSASLDTRLVVMKTWFVAFDIATIGLVVWLLRLTGQPKTLCIVYAWCPLVMKEVANSGHLDAVAVMLTTLALICALKARCDTASDATRSRETRLRRISWSLTAAFVLALAIGAKLYPVILLPLVAWVLARALVRDWGTLGGMCLWFGLMLTFTATTAIVLSPMLPESSPSNRPLTDELAHAETPALPPLESASYEPQDPSHGIETFLRHWEMNDFLFMIVVENLKPLDSMAPGEVAWFSVLPRPGRDAIVNPLQTSGRLPSEQAPFLVTRMLTSGVFLLLAIWFAYRGSRAESPARVLQFAFLTVAWFWLLSPTQNPWYWTWALPLLPFARARVWLLISGLVMVYYLRFWLDIHWPQESVLGTGYGGTQFFDFVVTWFEFAPFFAILVGLASFRWLRDGDKKV